MPSETFPRTYLYCICIINPFLDYPRDLCSQYCFQGFHTLLYSSQGNLLKGVLSTVDLLSRSVRQTWTIVSVIIFHYFNFSTFTYNIGHGSENNFAIFNHFVSWVGYWEENIFKQIEITYLLTVLLSIPLDKLPCY